MSPLIEVTEFDPNDPRGKIRHSIPLYVWWSGFEESILNQEGEKYTKHKQELFGLNNITASPEIFSTFGIVRDWQMKPDEFQSLDIHTRAKMYAHNTIKNMLEIREQHLQIMKRKRESKFSNGSN